MTGGEEIPNAAELEGAARMLVTAAFQELAHERVIPTSRYHPWIRAGRDYAGPTLMGLLEFKTLETMLDAAYPARFSEPLTRRHAEFANHYLLHFIEACVRRCADTSEYHAQADAVAASIGELIAVLDAPHHTLAAVRAMSHIATTDGQPITVDGVEVVPELSRTDYDFFLSQCRARIPGSGGAFNREPPHVFAHPHAVLAATADTGDDADAFGAMELASHRLGRFTLLLRLLTGTTARRHFEVQGPTTLIGPVHPHILYYSAAELPPSVRRTAVVDASYEPPIQALGAMYDSAEVKRADMVAASFDVAIGRFTSSFATDGLTAVVDLATALEAIFVDEPDGTGGIIGRLRTRAAALLATPADPAANIFKDVGAFYSLRSTLVHGGNLSEKTLRNRILGIATVTEKDMFGIAAAEAVDRMRDLVRRAILARLCLASGDQPMWPFNPRDSIEVAFADDVRRGQMRQSWRARLLSIGAGWAAEHLRAPGHTLREDYGRTDAHPTT